jgi:prepilin-type N-terminal cleavage/methylation domain-containing protein
MKKIIKKTESKKGLSLVEVICVIAIICILAGAILFNYINIFRNAIDALGGF